VNKSKLFSPVMKSPVRLWKHEGRKHSNLLDRFYGKPTRIFPSAVSSTPIFAPRLAKHKIQDVVHKARHRPTSQLPQSLFKPTLVHNARKHQPPCHDLYCHLTNSGALATLPFKPTSVHKARHRPTLPLPTLPFKPTFVHKARH
jgi:hypothetical protein